MTEPNAILERARHELLVEYERGAKIDISEWVTRYPDLRDDLLDYWIFLRATPRSHANAPVPTFSRDDVALRASTCRRGNFAWTRLA